MKTITKKMLVLLLAITLSCTMLMAEEGDKNADGKYIPVFELSIPIIEGQFETDTVAKEHSGRINTRAFFASDVKAGVAIKVLDGFYIIPTVNYKGIKTDFNKVTPSLFAGLGFLYEPVENLKLNFAIGYAGMFEDTMSMSIIHDVYSGGNISAGVEYNLDSAFLNIKADDSFSFLADTSNKVNKKVNTDLLNNNLSVGVVFNFFQFFMPDFEAGLYADFALDTTWNRDGIQDKATKTVKQTNVIDFGLGLIMKPIDFFTFKTGLVVNADSTKSKTGSGSYGTPAKNNKIGFLMASEFGFGKASITFDYTPYFAGKNGSTAWENYILHELNLGFNYKY